MGSIQSPSALISAFRFSALPPKAVTGKIVQFDGDVLVLGSRGGLYTTKRILCRNVHCGGVWEWSQGLHDALDALGLLTVEHREKHQTWMEEKERRRLAVDEIRQAHYAARCKHAVINWPALIALWDSLPHYDQWKAKEYMPPGATMKPEDKR